MILFYDKTTGKIEGTIDGRVHPKEHLNMWVGDKDQTERIIINWKPVRYYDKAGYVISEDNLQDRYTADFEPEHEQKDLFVAFEKREDKLTNYRVDITTKTLIPKD